MLTPEEKGQKAIHEAQRRWPKLSKAIHPVEVMDLLTRWLKEQGGLDCADAQGAAEQLKAILRERIAQAPKAEIVDAFTEHIASAIIKTIRQKLHEGDDEAETGPVEKLW